MFNLLISIINKYLLDWSRKNEKVAMNYKKYRQPLLMLLTGDFRILINKKTIDAPGR